MPSRMLGNFRCHTPFKVRRGERLSGMSAITCQVCFLMCQ